LNSLIHSNFSFLETQETGTLSGKKLKNILLAVIFDNHKNIIAFPTFWKSFFQKLDFLETASTLDPDAFQYVGSYEFSSIPLIFRCDSCLKLSELPACYYIQRSSLPCLCSFSTDGNICTLSFHEKNTTRRIFPSKIFFSRPASIFFVFLAKKEYNLYEIARFVHKVVAVTVQEVVCLTTETINLVVCLVETIRETAHSDAFS
jgi:hypothetical protein